VNVHTLFSESALPAVRGLTLAHPQALYFFGVVAVVLVWWLWQAGGVLRSAAPLLRGLILSLFVLALADPRTVMRSEGSARPVLIDASASITPPMRDFTVKLLRGGLGFRASDPAVVFAGAPVSETIGAAESALTTAAGCAGCVSGATNLEAALNKIAADPAASDGPVVLVTDGWQNQGDAGTAVNALRAAGIQLYIFTPPGAQSIPNVAMTTLSLPPALAKAEPFALGVTMMNLNATSAAGSISIYRNGALLDQREVTIAPGQTRYDFPVRVQEAGLLSYRAVFKPANPAQDVYPEDDSLQGWVGIGAQRKVLILTGGRRDANYLDTVVRRLGFEPSTVVLADGEYSGNPRGYDAVILNNVPRVRLTAAAQAALAEYAAGGGSLAMVGGDQSFGLGGYQDSPIAKVMPVTMKPPQRHERKRALVLIIDKSGSMGRNDKLVYAKAAATTVTKTLSDADLLSVIGFDSQPFVVIPLEPLSQIRPYFQDLIDRLKARGTTYLLPALEEAERTLAQSGAAVKHVVILTDGETGGTASMYYDLVSSMHREGGATISAIAIGREANLPLLEAIARYGGGGFYQTDSPQNLPELFLEDVKQRGGDTTMVEKDFVPYSVKPDPVLKELAGRQLPALKGFVASDLKPGATLSLFVNANGERSPIVASWKVGAGKALAVTTDASGRWSSLWVQDGAFGPVWDKLLGWMTPQTATIQKFDVALGYRSGRIEISLTDYNDTVEAAVRPVNAAVSAPDGSNYDVILSQEAPGELAGSLEAPKPGTYYIQLKPPQGSAQTFPPLAYTVSPAIAMELPRPGPNYGLLEHLASATGGRLNPSPAELALSRPESEQAVSMSSYLVLAAMLLLIGEALIRRLTF
jgi:Ca-activated chloride channel family protein